MTRSERFWMWLAWMLPRRLVYWATIRCGTAASLGPYSGESVPDVKLYQILERWPLG